MHFILKILQIRGFFLILIEWLQIPPNILINNFKYVGDKSGIYQGGGGVNTLHKIIWKTKNDR